MEHTVKSVTLSNGLRLPYVEQGDAAGVPVVLLHGITDSWRSYECVLPYLPRSMRAFALTQRGHGDANRPRTGYRAQDMAADVDQFMTAVGLDRAVVVGHSMGSFVAQRFAIDCPDRVLGLVLIGSRASWRTHPDIPGLCEQVAALTDPVDPEFAAEFQRSTIAQPVPTSLFETAVAESLKLPARVWRAAFVECLLGPEHEHLLGAIRTPTLLMCGARDTLAWDVQASLREAIPGARLEAYADAGHALHWEEPVRFAADLSAFVEGVASSSRERSLRAAAG